MNPEEQTPPSQSGWINSRPLIRSLLTILVVLNILSVFLLIPIPILKIALVHLNVTVGEVNGTLTLGTLDYCLEVSDQRMCHPSPPKLAYAISQFFSNHRIS